MFKKVLIIIVIVLVLLMLGLVGLIQMQPNDFRVERSTTINASPAAVFPHVNDFRLWQQWSPWAELDPECEYTYAGPDAGTGAIFAWSGNSDVGEGRMTILESRPHEFIQIELHFIRPFESTSTTEYTFEPAGDGTTVTWAMHGQHNFFTKAMCLIMDMDDMLGPDFERDWRV